MVPCRRRRGRVGVSWVFMGFVGPATMKSLCVRMSSAEPRLALS